MVYDLLNAPRAIGIIKEVEYTSLTYCDDGQMPTQERTISKRL